MRRSFQVPLRPAHAENNITDSIIAAAPLAELDHHLYEGTLEVGDAPAPMRILSIGGPEADFAVSMGTQLQTVLGDTAGERSEVVLLDPVQQSAKNAQERI